MSAQRRKGTAAETAVTEWLRHSGFPYAERRALAGNADKGDITGIPGVVIEIKNCKRVELAEWVDELETEIANAGADTGAVIHKRRGTTNPGRWFATLPAERLLQLLKDAGY